MTKYITALSKLVTLNELGIKFELCDYDLSGKYYVEVAKYSTRHQITDQVSYYLIGNCNYDLSKIFIKCTIDYEVKDRTLIPIRIKGNENFIDIDEIKPKPSFWKRIMGKL